MRNLNLKKKYDVYNIKSTHCNDTSSSEKQTSVEFVESRWVKWLLEAREVHRGFTAANISEEVHIIYLHYLTDFIFIFHWPQNCGVVWCVCVLLVGYFDEDLSHPLLQSVQSLWTIDTHILNHMLRLAALSHLNGVKTHFNVKQTQTSGVSDSSTQSFSCWKISP